MYATGEEMRDKGRLWAIKIVAGGGNYKNTSTVLCPMIQEAVW